ncbi:MAG TPA: ROK family transcriptional regulator [Euzebya sp.]|nr:ROK family transcriptional regulator [Euzebya sp.]
MSDAVDAGSGTSRSVSGSVTGSVTAVRPAAARRPADVQAVREHNLSLVLGRLLTGGPRSRARLAEETGLNRTTVSSLVAELLERQLVRETAIERPGAVGRPAQMLEPDPTRWVGVGLEVNIQHLAVSVRDLNGATRAESLLRRDNSTSSAEDTLAALVALYRQVLAPLRLEGVTPAGAVLGVPGLVDFAAGQLHVAPNLGWPGVSVLTVLGELLAPEVFPLVMDNDANLAVLAEMSEGVARDRSDVIYVGVDIGVGGAVVVDGHVHRGHMGFAGELGHMPVTRDGPRCSCGRRGCLEAYVGQRAMLRAAGRDVSKAVGSSDVARQASDLASDALRGEPEVLAMLEEVGHWLGFALASMSNAFNPSTIVLGGLLGRLGPWLVAPVREEVEQRTVGIGGSPIEVLSGGVGVTATARGGAAMAVRRLIATPTLTDHLQAGT